MDLHRDILKALGSDPHYNQSRAGWLVARCPLMHWDHDGGVDNNPSFAIKNDTGDAFSHCFSCGWHGSLSDLITAIKYRNFLDHKLQLDAVLLDSLLDILGNSLDEFTLPPGTIEDVFLGGAIETELFEFPEGWIATFPSWHASQNVKEYLDKREVPIELRYLYDLRFDPVEGRICIPVRDFNGMLVGLHGRSINGGSLRYRMYLYKGKCNPIVWLGEHLVRFDIPLVVVEGPFDLFSVARVYPNVASPLFANPSVKKIRRMSSALEQTIFLDRGKGGDKGRDRFKKSLSNDHILKFVIPPDGFKDPGSMSANLIRLSLHELF